MDFDRRLSPSLLYFLDFYFSITILANLEAASLTFLFSKALVSKKHIISI
jgi:hypothetical protein